MTSYDGANVLVTGGLGFLGSSTALALAAARARVTVLDNRLEGHGANDANLVGSDTIRVVEGDVREASTVDRLVREADFVFHLAGQVDHGASVVGPFLDLDINARGTLTVLEAVRLAGGRARVVTTGTRAEYGPVATVPVREDAPTNPQGCYAVSKLAGTRYAVTYHMVHGLRTTATRLTNVYGPRGQMRHDRYGVANWFLRRALDGEAIRVFGDGRIRRDYVYVDDAVDALLGLGLCEAAVGAIVNIGGTTPATLVGLAQSAIAAAGRGRIEYVDYPAGKRALEPGDFWADISALRALTGWVPRVELGDGMKRAAGFYQEHRAAYW